MILQAHPEQRSHWALAFGGASLLHVGGLLFALDLLPSFDAPAPPAFFEQISVATVFVPDDQLEAMIANPEGGLPEPEPEPEPEAAPAEAAPEPEPIAPTAPEAETLRADEATAEVMEQVTDQVLSPITPEGDLVLQGATVAVERIAAAAPEVLPPTEAEPVLPEPVAAPTEAPTLPAAAVAPPSEADLALQDLVQRIRARLSDPCLVALPQSQGPALPPLVQLIADQDLAMRRFQAEVLSDPDLPVDSRATLVDRRQCPALNFLRERPNYPAFQLGLALASREVASGEALVGTIEGVGGAYTSLLLIDDNGVVQDLRRFMRFTSGRAEFAVPVTRDGAARDTSQLLMAIATADRPGTIGAQAGQLAERFFPPLAAEIGSVASFAILTFDVR